MTRRASSDGERDIAALAPNKEFGKLGKSPSVTIQRAEILFLRTDVVLDNGHNDFTWGGFLVGLP